MDKKLSLLNMNKVLRVFVLNSDEDDAYETMMINNISAMRKILKCKVIGYDSVTIEGKPYFIIANGESNTGKLSGIGTKIDNPVFCGNIIVTGASKDEDGVPMFRSLTDDEIKHVMKNLTLMRHVKDNDMDTTYSMYSIINIVRVSSRQRSSNQ